MIELYEQFQKWGGDNISVFDLNDLLHKFHDGISRELYKRYVMMDPDFSVATRNEREYQWIIASLLSKEERF